MTPVPDEIPVPISEKICTTEPRTSLTTSATVRSAGGGVAVGAGVAVGTGVGGKIAVGVGTPGPLPELQAITATSPAARTANIVVRWSIPCMVRFLSREESSNCDLVY